jgi:hypothetical protein
LGGADGAGAGFTSGSIVGVSGIVAQRLVTKKIAKHNLLSFGNSHVAKQLNQA